ncbi:MAG: hypothetical protein ACE5PO_09110, partial [Candidatus Bathyarchaeia archaeon]
AAYASWWAKKYSLIWAIPSMGGTAYMLGAGVDGIAAAVSALGAYTIEQSFFRGLLATLTVGEIISGIHLSYLAWAIESYGLEKAEGPP